MGTPSDQFLSQPAVVLVFLLVGREFIAPPSVSVPLFTIEETQERDQLARQGQGWALVRSLSSVLGPIVFFFWRVRSFLLWTKLHLCISREGKKSVSSIGGGSCFSSTPTSHTTLTLLCPSMAPLTSRIKFHATALALSSWEPAATDTEHWPHSS
jgi:hypothetical protein